jgi:hypothetical protein
MISATHYWERMAGDFFQGFAGEVQSFPRETTALM